MELSSRANLKREVLIDGAGEKVAIYLSEPQSGPARKAIVLLPAIAGVNDYVADIAQMLSDDGYLVAVLDYFSRTGSVPDLSTPELIGAAVASVDDRRVLSDIGLCLDWLEYKGIPRGKTGLLGYCIGGTYAVLGAAQVGGAACAVAYYGQLRYANKTEFKPVDPMTVASRIQVPLLGHFGLMDRLIAPEEVDDFEAQLKFTQRHFELFTYRGAPHAFDEWFRPAVYRPCASKEAWSRTKTFFRWHLKN